MCASVCASDKFINLGQDIGGLTVYELSLLKVYVRECMRSKVNKNVHQELEPEAIAISLNKNRLRMLTDGLL